MSSSGSSTSLRPGASIQGIDRAASGGGSAFAPSSRQPGLGRLSHNGALTTAAMTTRRLIRKRPASSAAATPSAAAPGQALILRVPPLGLCCRDQRATCQACTSLSRASSSGGCEISGDGPWTTKCSQIAGLSGSGHVPSNVTVNDRAALMLSPAIRSSSRYVAGSRTLASLGGQGCVISMKIGLAPSETRFQSTDVRSTIRSECGKTSTGAGWLASWFDG
jgi:hypothetical protein